MQLELCKEFTFEASHILPKHPGKCSRLHGHSWKLRVYIQGIVSKDTGFVLDYAELKNIVQPLIDELDHRHLGSWDHPIFDQSFTEEKHFIKGMPFDFYPSSENLIVWIANWLRDEAGMGLVWSRLELDETCTSRCILTREEYDGSIRNG